jgi:hypothetical protein
MDRITHAAFQSELTDERRMLLETLAGHLELLKTNHPRKAASNTARKVQRYVAQSLRPASLRKRAA